MQGLACRDWACKGCVSDYVSEVFGLLGLGVGIQDLPDPPVGVYERGRLA